jgi:hypothetical protein
LTSKKKYGKINNNQTINKTRRNKMSKSLRSITNDVERRSVISRRLSNGKNVKGLGYWAAVDAEKREQEKKGKNTGLTPRDVIKVVIGE